MIKQTDPIVVFGAGSIGERHIRILLTLGYKTIWVYRQRKLPLRTIETSSVSIFTDINEIIRTGPSAAIICTPTSQHMAQALFCLQHKIPVLVEKPLSNNLAETDELKRLIMANKTYLQVAYMLRYHPLFLKIRAIIDSRKLGKLVHMQSCWTEYLPDWHPWENYEESYAARKELGGGAALTLSHDIDLLNWLADMPVSQFQIVKDYTKMPHLDVESAADISMTYENGITAQCHLNFHTRLPKRWYRFVFDDGCIEMDYQKSELITFHKQKMITQSLPDFDRNQLYQAQILDFFEQLKKENRVARALKSVEESEKIISIANNEKI